MDYDIEINTLKKRIENLENILEKTLAHLANSSIDNKENYQLTFTFVGNGYWIADSPKYKYHIHMSSDYAGSFYNLGVTTRENEYHTVYSKEHILSEDKIKEFAQIWENEHRKGA